jgi:hypothetical protein
MAPNQRQKSAHTMEKVGQEEAKNHQEIEADKMKRQTNRRNY